MAGTRPKAEAPAIRIHRSFCASIIMNAPPRLAGIAALLFATASWGGMFLVSKDVLAQVDPMWLTFIRYSMSALLFAALLLVRGAAPWRQLRAQAAPLALRGVAGFGVFSVLLLAGLARSVPSHGAILMATTPISAQLLRWALDGIRPSRVTIASTLLALAGVAIVSGLLLGPDAQDPGASTLVGDAIAFVGTLGWVWYTRGAARFPQLNAVDYSALTVLAAWPLLLAGTVVSTALDLAEAPSAEGLRQCAPALLYVGVVSSAVAVLAFNLGVRSLGPVTGTAFLNFVPVSTMLMSAAMGKAPTGSEILGMSMVVVALLVHTATSRTASPARAPATAACGQNGALTCKAAP